MKYVGFIGYDIPVPEGVHTLGQYMMYRKAIVQWLEQNVGKESDNTWYAAGVRPDNFRGIWFAHDEDVLAFKLRFGL